MAKLQLVLVLCAMAFEGLQADKGNGAKNDSEITGRSGRYGFPDTYENRLPYEEAFHDSQGLYPEFEDRRDRYDGEDLDRRGPPYEIPTGFDQFVPDKSSKSKYSYGPGGFYLPYSPKVKPDYAVEEIENRNRVATPVPVNSPTPVPKIKDMLLGAVKNLLGGDESDAFLIDRRPPTFLSVVKQLFSDPLVALVAIVIPIGFLLANFVPFLTKMVMKSSLVPAVTTTIANTVARGLDSPAAEEILGAIDDFGARMAREPRCLQRMFCQVTKSRIESRSGDSWSAQKIVRKLIKTVDEKLWDALGLKMLFRSIRSGRCENLACSADLKSFTDVPLKNTLLKLLSKLFNTTKTEVL